MGVHASRVGRSFRFRLDKFGELSFGFLFRGSRTLSVTPTYHLYIDDSGSRDLDRNLDAQDGSKWFALGGILIAEEDEAAARKAYDDFCAKWEIDYPLHSYDIRNRVNRFSWIAQLRPRDQADFYKSLGDFLTDIPVVGTACVIDRLGYNTKYREKYGTRRWALCKTAFTIVAERSAKFAFQQNRRMKIYYERCSPPHDKAIEKYFSDMRNDGMPFNADTSAKYDPFGQTELKHTLWDCKKKSKTSPMIQIADLYLFPLCVAGYDQTYRAYTTLYEKKRVIDCHIDENILNKLGVKYSCFEIRKEKGEG